MGLATEEGWNHSPASNIEVQAIPELRVCSNGEVHNGRRYKLFVFYIDIHIITLVYLSQSSSSLSCKLQIRFIFTALDIWKALFINEKAHVI